MPNCVPIQTFQPIDDEAGNAISLYLERFYHDLDLYSKSKLNQSPGLIHYLLHQKPQPSALRIHHPAPPFSRPFTHSVSLPNSRKLMEDKVPFELWLKILSYLPRSYRRKMIGVNRPLFEYAMDEVFRTLTLAADDEWALFMITRLQDENVAKRVTHLTIRLSSIPNAPSPSYIQDLGRPQKKNGKNKFFWFLKSKEPKTVGAGGQRVHRFSEQWNLNDMFWSFAERNIMLCTNASELKIILDAKGSLNQTPQSFESFFHSIWLPTSILPGIRKLTVEATAHNLSKFVLPMYRFASFWKKLDHVEINIDPSHKSVININSLLMHSFLDALKDKLVSFTLSGHLIPNVANILRFSPRFSKLREFEIYSIFNVHSLHQVEYLDIFLSAHADTLERVLISPQVRLAGSGSATGSFRSSYLFINWLGLPPPHNIIPTQGSIVLPNANANSTPKQTSSLSQLSLPRLHTLELRYDYQWIDDPIPHHLRSPFQIPNLSSLAPNLTSLTIGEAEMSLGRVAKLLEVLPRGPGTGKDGLRLCALERLELEIDMLPPELVDLLSGSVQRLRWLKLRLLRYVVSSDLEQYMFYQTIRTRKYPSWNLEYLRIVASSLYCPSRTPHPNMLAMQAVAETLTDPPMLDTSFECECHLL